MASMGWAEACLIEAMISIKGLHLTGAAILVALDVK
jgi:hypothetical protein